MLLSYIILEFFRHGRKDTKWINPISHELWAIYFPWLSAALIVAKKNVPCYKCFKSKILCQQAAVYSSFPVVIHSFSCPLRAGANSASLAAEIPQKAIQKASSATQPPQKVSGHQRRSIDKALSISFSIVEAPPTCACRIGNAFASFSMVTHKMMSCRAMSRLWNWCTVTSHELIGAYYFWILQRILPDCWEETWRNFSVGSSVI